MRTQLIHANRLWKTENNEDLKQMDESEIINIEDADKKRQRNAGFVNDKDTKKFKHPLNTFTPRMN